MGYLTWKAYDNPMCDTDEEEYAEYLLWREAASAREPSIPVRARGARSVVDAGNVPPKLVEETA